MYNDEEDYLLEQEKSNREIVTRIGNDLLTYLTNSFTGRICVNREIVEVFIQAFYKDVDKEITELVLSYIEKFE